MDSTTRVQIMNEAVSISNNTNTLGEGMSTIILPPTMCRLGYLTFVYQVVYGGVNSEFKPAKLCSKFDLV